MTVKDVFDLRRQGRIEEAYEAIRPMYAAHKGRYTTLCMFWTASDVFKLRMDEGRTEEAEKIYCALQRMLPRVQEVERQLQDEHGITGENASSGSAQFFIDYALKRLEKSHTEAEKKTESVAVAAADVPAPDKTENEPSEDTPFKDADDAGEAPQQKVDVRNIKGLTSMQRIVLGFIAANPGNKISSISYGLGMPAKIVETHLTALLDRNLIEHRESNKDGGYHVK